MELFSPEERATIEAAITKAERKTSGEIIVVAATASGGYFANALMWAAVPALRVPWPLIYSPTGRSKHLSRPARRLRHRRGAHPVGGFALRHRAEIHQARPRASEGRGAVPGAEPAHHQGPHRRDDLRVVRRALRRGDRRRGHLQEVPQATWNEVVDTLTAHLGRGARVEGFVTAIETCGKILAEHFPPAASITMSCPII